MDGRVTQVLERQVATALVAAAAIGDTSLDVDDVSAFDWNGGRLLLGSEVHGYTVSGADDLDSDEIDLDDTPDPDSGTLLLTEPLVGAFAVDDVVTPYPQVYERTAFVLSEEQEEEIGVRVPHSLYDRVPAGLRDDDDAELLEFERYDDELVATDVPGQEPDIDGSFLNASHGEQASVLGYGAVGASYSALDGAVTVEPERDCLCLVQWSTAIVMVAGGFTLNGTGFGSLLVNGAQIGAETICGISGKFDSSGPTPQAVFPVGGQAIVEMEAGQAYVLAVGVKAVMVAGSAGVQAGKYGGLSYAFFGG